MKSFKGLNGTIILRDSGVAIVRENMLGTTFHNGGEVEIPYSNVSEVEVVPGALLNGFICIVENGYGSPSNVFSAMKDENTIIFRLTRNGQAKKMKRLIEERL
jgi:hypothetical protein